MRNALVLVAALVLATCAQRPSPTHEVYVWQRAWTPSLRAVVTDARRDFAALRVLIAESDRRGTLHLVDVDIGTLAAAGLPVTAVVRLNGTDPDVDVVPLAQGIAAVTTDWREHAIDVAGVEIDYDCANAKLPAYAAMLRGLRRHVALPRLSITALPAWLDAAALDDVLAEVDEAVLQVHAVLPPAQGLFAPKLAENWIRRFAARSGRPFRIALPAYGSAVDFDADDRPVSVESEVQRDRTGVRRDELRVAPDEVATVLAALRRAPPSRLVGIVWFRLPLPEDRRAWSLATLRAVIAGRPLEPKFAVAATPGPNGAVDLAIANIGEIDAVPDGVIDVGTSGCEGDALPGFHVDEREGRWRLVVDAGVGVLRAGRTRAAGWVRCAHVSKVQWHARP